MFLKPDQLAKAGERRSDKAKIGEKTEFAVANEYFEPIFNAV
jgi:hypothetical protein